MSLRSVDLLSPRPGPGSQRRALNPARRNPPRTRHGHTLYDGRGNLTLAEDFEGNTIRVVYDGFGQKRRLWDRDAGFHEFYYDRNGNFLGSETPIARVFRNYDVLDRPMSEFGGGQWSYDQATNGIGRISRRGRYIGDKILEYDLLGRIRREQFTTRKQVNVVQEAVHDFETKYDGLGQVTERVYPTGTRIEWEYDPRGFLTAIHADGSSSIATGIAWDALGRAKEWVAGNGVQTARSFEPDTLRLGGVQVLAPSGTPLLDLQYGYLSDDRAWGVLDQIAPTQSQFFASSEESVGELWLRKLSK